MYPYCRCRCCGKTHWANTDMTKPPYCITIFITHNAEWLYDCYVLYKMWPHNSFIIKIIVVFLQNNLNLYPLQHFQLVHEHKIWISLKAESSRVMQHHIIIEKFYLGSNAWTSQCSKFSIAFSNRKSLPTLKHSFTTTFTNIPTAYRYSVVKKSICKLYYYKQMHHLCTISNGSWWNSTFHSIGFQTLSTSNRWRNSMVSQRISSCSNV